MEDFLIQFANDVQYTRLLNTLNFYLTLGIKFLGFLALLVLVLKMIFKKNKSNTYK